MKKTLTFAMLLLALPIAAQDLAVSPVAGPIHMISGRGGNIGVSAGADGFLMIDDKFAPLADQLPHAHTDGDALIFFAGANVIHMGDTFFNQRLPYVDIDGGGSVQGVIAAVEMVLAESDADTKIIPGHGPLATPEDLKTYLRMIKESQATVAAGLKAGQSLEELQAAGVGEEWASWSGGFISTERWVETLHRSQ